MATADGCCNKQNSKDCEDFDRETTMSQQECVLNYRLEPLGNVEGFTAEVGASGSFCPSHMTLPVDVSFYSVSDDNAPSPYMVRSPFQPINQ